MATLRAALLPPLLAVLAAASCGAPAYIAGMLRRTSGVVVLRDAHGRPTWAGGPTTPWKL